MVFRENGGKSVVANGVLKGDNRILTANERGGNQINFGDTTHILTGP